MQRQIAYAMAQPMQWQIAYAMAQPMQWQIAYAMMQPMQWQISYAMAQPMQWHIAYAMAQPMHWQIAYAMAQPMQWQIAYAVAQPIQWQIAYAMALCYGTIGTLRKTLGQHAMLCYMYIMTFYINLPSISPTFLFKLVTSDVVASCCPLMRCTLLSLSLNMFITDLFKFV